MAIKGKKIQCDEVVCTRPVIKPDKWECGNGHGAHELEPFREFNRQATAEYEANQESGGRMPIYTPEKAHEAVHAGRDPGEIV